MAKFLYSLLVCCICITLFACDKSDTATAVAVGGTDTLNTQETIRPQMPDSLPIRNDSIQVTDSVFSPT